jgi:hypothetical protein
MSQPFVGTTQSPIDLETLETLIKRCINSNGWQFLRWPHQVKMLPLSQPTELDCQEGQAFDQVRELRWKRKGEGYEVLLLSETDGNEAFLALGQSWKTKSLDAQTYPETETRFPRGVKMPVGLNDLGQRYFIDAETACVQFIALRVK